MGHCEQDEHAERSYRALFDTRGEWFCDDIRKADAGSMPDFELLCGGFPCQSFSIAGSRHGFADPRGTLFFELARVAEARKPPYLLFENVPGLGYKMAYPGDSIDLAYPQMNTRRGRVGRQIAHILTTDATQGTLEPRPVRTPLVSSPERNPSRTGKPGAPMFTLTTKDRHGISGGDPCRMRTERDRCEIHPACGSEHRP